MHNSGGYQATSLLPAAAWKVIFIELELNISNAQLARGTPCQTTLSNLDYKLAAESATHVPSRISKMRPAMV